jgi:hypothetical protein
MNRACAHSSPIRMGASATVSDVDIASGFQLEQPHVFVPWGISEEQLQNLFKGMELRPITGGLPLR